MIKISDWPIYKPELLTIGSRKSNTGLCTLWTKKEKVLKKVSPENFLLAGCLNLVQALVQDKLHMTFYLRSNDMFRAWPENAFAFRAVQYEVAEKTGIEPGNLVIISNSAHIYSANWEEARKILSEHRSRARGPDPRGNILVSLEDGRIKVSHLSPHGHPIGEFYAESAIEAYRMIDRVGMISVIGHALDIGVELAKAETALRNDLEYVQDKPIKIK